MLTQMKLYECRITYLGHLYATIHIGAVDSTQAKATVAQYAYENHLPYFTSEITFTGDNVWTFAK